MVCTLLQSMPYPKRADILKQQEKYSIFLLREPFRIPSRSFTYLTDFPLTPMHQHHIIFTKEIMLLFHLSHHSFSL